MRGCPRSWGDGSRSCSARRCWSRSVPPRRVTPSAPTASATTTRAPWGKPVPGFEVELRDRAGAPVPDGTAGELWVRGPTVTPGYLNRPEETERTLVRGWLATHDRAVREPDGTYRHLGRADDLEMVGGITVSPLEVEAVLRVHPAVKEVAVVSVTDGTGVVEAAGVRRTCHPRHRRHPRPPQRPQRPRPRRSPRPDGSPEPPGGPPAARPRAPGRLQGAQKREPRPVAPPHPHGQAPPPPGPPGRLVTRQPPRRPRTHERTNAPTHHSLRAAPHTAPHRRKDRPHARAATPFADRGFYLGPVFRRAADRHGAVSVTLDRPLDTHPALGVDLTYEVLADVVEELSGRLWEAGCGRRSRWSCTRRTTSTSCC